MGARHFVLFPNADARRITGMYCFAGREQERHSKLNQQDLSSRNELDPRSLVVGYQQKHKLMTLRVYTAQLCCHYRGNILFN
jgi:hypothetical protein